MLTKEDGWASLADGLHIQRHFHEARRPLAERRRRLIVEHGGLPAECEALAHLSSAELEHLLHPHQPSAARPGPDAMASRRGSLAGRAVLLVADETCVAVGDRRLLDAGRLVDEAPPRLSGAYEASVDEALDAVALTYIPQLNLGVVVLGGDARDRCAFRMEDGLYGTVVADPSLPAWRFAEEICAQLAAQWLQAFLLAQPDPAEPAPRAWMAPWTNGPLDSPRMASSILARAIRYRFRRRLSMGETVVRSRTERALLSEQAREIAEELADVEAFVESVDEVFANPDRHEQEPYNNLDIADLLRTFVPGRRQFRAYFDGAGAGQAE